MKRVASALRRTKGAQKFAATPRPRVRTALALATPTPSRRSHSTRPSVSECESREQGARMDPEHSSEPPAPPAPPAARWFPVEHSPWDEAVCALVASDETSPSRQLLALHEMFAQLSDDFAVRRQIAASSFFFPPKKSTSDTSDTQRSMSYASATSWRRSLQPANRRMPHRLSCWRSKTSA